MVTEPSELFANAPSPISLTDEGIVTLVTPLDANAYGAIFYYR